MVREDLWLVAVLAVAVCGVAWAQAGDDEADDMVWHDGPVTHTETWRSESWRTEGYGDDYGAAWGEEEMPVYPALARRVQDEIDVRQVTPLGRDGIRAMVTYRGQRPLGELTIAAVVPGTPVRIEADLPAPVMPGQMLALRFEQDGSRLGRHVDDVLFDVVDAAPWSSH
jgi:hypothetical protein